MKNVIVIAAMVLVSITAWAQPKGSEQGKKFSVEDKMEDRLEYMTIVLDLNESQVQKIQKMQKANSENMKSIKAKYQPIKCRPKGDERKNEINQRQIQNRIRANATANEGC